MVRHTLIPFVIVALSLFGHAQNTAEKQRHFVLHYVVKVKDVPAGKELRIWIPFAHSDAFQDIQVLRKEGDLKLHKSVEDEFGNTALYAETDTTKTRDYRFVIDYDVVRFERVDLTDGKLAPGAHPERASQAVQQRFLGPNRLVPTSGPAAQTAAEETKSAGTSVEKAHAIYDYLWRTLRYDPAASGCCQGDANRTLDTKGGDSTDFTAVFVAMARSQQIPARSAVGFQLPADKHSAEITKHASWAEFYANPQGWLPVDVAAASQHSDLREYYFGAQDMNRMQFTVGRDFKLNPPQEGGPLNFFIEPYVEVGGKQYSKIALDVSFSDAGASAAGPAVH